jgi:hypothetical protein
LSDAGSAAIAVPADVADAEPSLSRNYTVQKQSLSVSAGASVFQQCLPAGQLMTGRPAWP